MELTGPWLVLDASCPVTQIAILLDGKRLGSSAESLPAMQSMLKNVSSLCDEHAIPIESMAGYIYCSGPGSVLGIRLSIMAIKTWCMLHGTPETNVLTYNSLNLAAKQLSTDKNPGDRFLVCSEWKKDHWNVLNFEKSQSNPQIEVWDKSKIDAFKGRKFILHQRKIWTEQSEDLESVNYSVEQLQHSPIRKGILHPSNHWEIYTPEASQYAIWSGERHRMEN